MGFFYAHVLPLIETYSVPRWSVDSAPVISFLTTNCVIGLLIINQADQFKFLTESSICQEVLFAAALYGIDQSEHFYGHEYDELVYDDSHIVWRGIWDKIWKWIVP